MGGLPYFPLKRDRFEHQFAVRALLADEPILERTDSYAEDIARKRSLLARDRDYYFQAYPESLPAQREASEWLIDRPCELIDTALEVQEDLVLLRGDVAAGHPIIAGAVCFPSGWAIADKIGQPIDTVHAAVPEYAAVMSRATNQLLEQLKPGRPVWRMNWGVRPSGNLDQSPQAMARLRAAAPPVTIDRVGQECYFRVERQTLSRLPLSQSILFTIHTHHCPLADLDATQQRTLLGVLQTCPPATARYKGFDSFANIVCEYLQLQM